MDPRLVSHPAAVAYGMNLLQAHSRGSPVPYGVGHTSPLGPCQQSSPDKELQPEISRNGTASGRGHQGVGTRAGWGGRVLAVLMLFAGLFQGRQTGL